MKIFAVNFLISLTLLRGCAARQGGSWENESGRNICPLVRRRRATSWRHRSSGDTLCFYPRSFSRSLAHISGSCFAHVHPGWHFLYARLARDFLRSSGDFAR